LLGAPLEAGGRGRASVLAASLAASVSFAASMALLYLGLYRLALGLWLSSGASSAVLVSWAFRYYEGIRRLLRGHGVEVPRPLVGCPLAPLVAVVAPPAAGLLALAAYEGLLAIGDVLYSTATIPEEAITSRFGGVVRYLSREAAAAIVPLVLPVLAGEAVEAVPAAACLVLYLASQAGMLGDKACRGDLVDVVVWAEPPGVALDLEFTAEKWGVKD
jgi:hypothetical protein